MECFACSRTCPIGAIEIDKIDSCMRLLEGKHPVRLNRNKCTDCGKCNKICPTGEINLSAEGCSFCIICKNKPNCILPVGDRKSFFNSVSSLARFTVLMPRFIF